MNLETPSASSQASPSAISSPSHSGGEPNPIEPLAVPANPFTQEEFRLNWSKRDIEQRLGFRGGRFTSVNNWLTFLMGLVLTAGFYAILIFGLQRNPDARWFTAMFLERALLIRRLSRQVELPARRFQPWADLLQFAVMGAAAAGLAWWVASALLGLRGAWALAAGALICAAAYAASVLLTGKHRLVRSNGGGT